MSQELKVINFMGVRKLTSAISIAMVIASILSIAIFGLKGGLDFTGGTQLELLFDRPAELSKVRSLLEEKQLESPVAVLFGSDQQVMIRTQDEMKVKGRELIAEKITAAGGVLEAVERPGREYEGFSDALVIAGLSAEALQQAAVISEADFGRVQYAKRDDKTLVALENSLDSVYVKALLADMEAATGAKIQLRSSEFVGPQIGDELRDQGGLGLLTAFILVFLYVAVQFQWKFSVGAIVALCHDVIITLGVFSFFQWDFDLTVLAALLALIGYSINDTIVIYDRIRENFRVLRKMDALDVINISLTQTLGRSVMTSMTVFIVLVCLFVFGGELLRGFSTALIIGIVVGTYSSIYIAANITAALGIGKEDLMPKEKEGAEFDETP
ncbi:protein translocase subunit SecF [Cellvibrio sp. OA-2007]|uniref:protein translocase subunit SecF n=1 Tax=Cellvibrio sp. OA-2007 TaxID=529823 RepID=UPI0007854256|nr:protein translocase subunit SecF [Cellvibrio sp. OA-2007]